MAPVVPPADAKVMRKGTRSCRECRRRKIKCTWTSDHAQICRECSENDRTCVGQGFVNNSLSDKRSNLKIRIGKLESIIERLSKEHSDKALGVISETDSSSSPTNSSASLSNTGISMTQEQLRDLKSPLFDLFDNDVLLRKKAASITPDTSVTMHFNASTSDREKLLSVIADEPNILDVLSVAGDWWIAWEDQFPGAKDLKTRLTLRDSVSKQLAAEDLVYVASALVCIVISLQLIRGGYDDHDLQLSATTTTTLIERITIAVDQVVLSKQEYLESMAGVQLLILKAKQHVDSNQLRKSWLRIRQGIRMAQKINMATPVPGMPALEILGRQRFMGSLFEADRFMSLLLGLPYAMDDNFTDKLATEVIVGHPDIITRVRALRRITAIASGHVNDRNASSDPASIALSDSIQSTLTTAGSSLPLSWWSIRSHSDDLTSPMLSHENLMTQLWFYQTQAFLQLPFMLKAASDPAFESSRTICLDSCRSLITIFNTLRSNPVLSAYTCKCEDFQGLLGAIVLLVGLLHHASQGLEPTGSSFEADMELIETTKETFRYARTQQGGNIARQGLHVLDTLSSFLDLPVGEDEGPREASLFVPYFGTIAVQAESVWKRRAIQPDDGVPVVVEKPYYDRDAQFETTGQTHAMAGYKDQNEPETEDRTWYAWNGGMGGQASYWQADQLIDSAIDWDRMLIGPELQQDWTFLPERIAA